ncbi:unnamed protein product [Dovyalis caffra]|uniref:Subtilisin-like protease n=1 Tax=Dovyalis caffra TaxID=77055 RepID=A0AAV1RB93_9ROSI|nr:unnamed protein product [Dovyalis caffra]
MLVVEVVKQVSNGFFMASCHFPCSSAADFAPYFPGVVGVVRNRILSSHTTRSWDFLHFKPQTVDGILSKGHSGVGSIIGIMDTGIWPESKSFRDKGMAEVPSRWSGICQEGEGFNRSHCNRKIIGARWYIKGYEAEFGNLNTSDVFEFLSPRDAGGHGTHTSSTAAGGLVENASFMGLAQGLARGGAPSAWLAVYKVCWDTGGCAEADLLAAFDDAIFDGVDVISVSLGSPPPLATYVEDPVAIGSFHAVAKGISVICSAGNSGPYPQTVINTAPWVVTVAASTIDRAFPTGQALYAGKNSHTFHPIVYGENIAADNSYEDSASPKYAEKRQLLIGCTRNRSCDSGSLNATLARGKVILCFESRSQRSNIIARRTVLDVKGVGLIFAQFPTKDVSLSLDIPSIQVDFAIGTYLLTYMEASSTYKTLAAECFCMPKYKKLHNLARNCQKLAFCNEVVLWNRNPLVKFSFTKTVIGRQISPEIAFFSSRGPSSISPAVLKNWLYNCLVILASFTASIEDEYGQKTVAEGAPHKQADPFDYGGGHVDANKAMHPGLIFDMGTSDYIRFLCALNYNNSAISLMTRTRTRCKKSANFLVNLNFPSITIPELKQNLTVSRTVTNVGPVTSIYIARVLAPPGTYVTVQPPVLSFDSTRKKIKFKVTFCSQLRIQGRYSFGNLFWEDGFHVVRIPLIVRTVIDDFYAET